MSFQYKLIPFIVGFFVFSTSVFSQMEVYQLDTAVAVHYLSPMRDGLRSSNHELKLRAIQYAATWGNESDLPQLYALAKNDSKQSVSEESIQEMAAAIYAIGQLAKPESTGTLVQLLHASEIPLVIQEAWVALAKCTNPGQTLAVNKLPHESGVLREACDRGIAEALLIVKPDANLELFKQLLARSTQMETEARVYFATALGRTKLNALERSAIERWLMSEKDMQVLIPLCRVAAKYDMKAFLVLQCQSKNEQVRKAAFDQLGSLSGYTPVQLTTMVDKSKLSVAQRLQLKIRYLSPQPDEVILALQSPELSVRDQADVCEEWAKKSPGFASKWMEQLLENASDDFDRVYLIRKLANMPDLLEASIIARFDKASYATQNAYVEVKLQSLGNDTAAIFPFMSREFVRFWNTNDMGIHAQLAGWIADHAEVLGFSPDIIQLLSQALPLWNDPATIETYNEIVRAMNGFGLPQAKMESKFYRKPPTYEEWKKMRQAKAVITTSQGVITLQLDGVHAAESTWNFVSLAKSGYFNGIRFHRVVPNFVIQAGCPRGDGMSGMPYTISSELFNHNYKPFVIGMASAGKHTESAQWFITSAYTPRLNGRYTIFGEVVKGSEVVLKVNTGTTIVKVEIIE